MPDRMAPRQLVEIGPGCVVIFVKIHRDPKFSLCQKILPGSNERYLGILKVPIQIDTVSINSSILSNALWIKTGKNQERKLPQFLGVRLGPFEESPRRSTFVPMNSRRHIDSTDFSCFSRTIFHGKNRPLPGIVNYSLFPTALCNQFFPVI